jgi:hypothetical protein
VSGMPRPPKGYATCRVHDGERKLIPLGAVRQITHLVTLDEQGRNMGRPTVCGLTRFDQRNEQHEVVHPADLPGWSMGGGVAGPGIEQVKCEPCWAATYDTSCEVKS